MRREALLGLAAGLGAVLLVCVVLGVGRARTELYGGSHPSSSQTSPRVRLGDGCGERAGRQGQERWLCLGRSRRLAGIRCLTGIPHFVYFFADGAGHDPTIPSPIQSYSSYGIREATADNDGMSGQLFCNSRNGDCDQRVQVGTAGLWKRAAQDVSRLGSPQPRTRLLREPEDGTPLWGHPSQPLLSGAHVRQVLTPASLTHHPCGGPRPPLPPPPPHYDGEGVS